MSKIKPAALAAALAVACVALLAAVQEGEPQFVTQQYIPQEEMFHAPDGVVMAVTGEYCPTGWERVVTEEGIALFFPFGMLTDEGGHAAGDDGERYSDFWLHIACQKN